MDIHHSHHSIVGYALTQFAYEKFRLVPSSPSRLLIQKMVELLANPDMSKRLYFLVEILTDRMVQLGLPIVDEFILVIIKFHKYFHLR